MKRALKSYQPPPGAQRGDPRRTPMRCFTGRVLDELDPVVFQALARRSLTGWSIGAGRDRQAGEIPGQRRTQYRAAVPQPRKKGPTAMRRWPL